MCRNPIPLTLCLWAALALNALGAVLYVDVNSTNPVPPFAAWSTAATNIQDAIDAAAAYDQVLVAAGIYRTGGRTVSGTLTNRVVVDKVLTVQSLDGPAQTVIEGWQVPGSVNGPGAVRCVYLAPSATLVGFTLTNGATLGQYDTADRGEQSGGGAWCAATNAVLSNCVVVANACYWWGAGACAVTLLDCQLRANTNSNPCLGGGGGAALSRLNGCTLSDNWSTSGTGGGAFGCSLTDCVLAGNFDLGARNCTLDHCWVTAHCKLGIDGGVANGCTISSNGLPAANNMYGGGASGASLNDCWLYGNQATHGGGAYNCSLNHCVLSNNWAVRGGGLYLDNLATNSLNDSLLTANVAGDSGGGLYCLPGPKPLNLNRCTLAANAATNHGGGIAFPSGFNGIIANCTVATNTAGGNGGGFYCNSTPSGISSNSCFYGNVAGGSGGAAYWGKFTQCLLAGNQAAQGGGASGSSLTNCLLQDNRAGNGGGLSFGDATACSFFNNVARTNGGGANNAALRNCVLSGNAAVTGGGTYNGSAFNATVVGNLATNAGGGTALGSLFNSIVYFNTAPAASNFSGGTWTASCALPLPPGLGNFTNAPAFVDLAGDNLRLQTNSPCINSGNNGYVMVNSTDLDRRPRIVSAKVDVGAYEFQGPDFGEFIAWLQQYGLAADGSADGLDADADGLNNWQEWRARTDPTNASSVLMLQTAALAGANPTVSWQGLVGVTYYLQRATHLAAQPAFSSIQSNLVGQGSIISYTDTNAVGPGPFFYRLGVQ